MDVSLEPAPLAVLRGDDPLPRGAQLGSLLRDLAESSLQLSCQADALQYQTRLRRQIGDEFLFDGGEHFTWPFVDAEGAEQLPLVVNGDDPADPGDLRQ